MNEFNITCAPGGKEHLRVTATFSPPRKMLLHKNTRSSVLRPVLRQGLSRTPWPLAFLRCREGIPSRPAPAHTLQKLSLEGGLLNFNLHVAACVFFVSPARKRQKSDCPSGSEFVAFYAEDSSDLRKRHATSKGEKAQVDIACETIWIY